MPSSVLSDLGLTIPIVAAPMAGGPTTPELVVAASAAGGVGFLAGGYKSPDAVADQIAAVRRETATFGVNLFAPNPMPVDPADYTRYRDAVRVDAARFGAAIPDEQIDDDDGWCDKIDLLIADPPPLVSFTFASRTRRRSPRSARRAASSSRPSRSPKRLCRRSRPARTCWPISDSPDPAGAAVIVVTNSTNHRQARRPSDGRRRRTPTRAPGRWRSTA
ncbi:MAG: nitronate monooxygenase [Pseudonocardiales bacterium]|nr:nitronate monooxygenase [Pseudonocardiales bacterium]